MTDLHDIRREVGPAPARLVWTGDDAARAGHRGALLFVHGFGVDIDIQTLELHAVARAGYLAVGLDAIGHGARRWPDFQERFGTTSREHAQTFYSLVRDTAAEVPAVIDALLAEGLAAGERVGMGGISMGGYVTYRARVVEPRLSVLLPILASPVWPVLEDDSPHRHAARFPPVAMLSQNAADDEMVKADQAAAFAAELRELYADQPDRLRHIEHAGERHLMSEEGWHRLWGNVMDWLASAWPTAS
jgi:dienelactone hydrolase